MERLFGISLRRLPQRTRIQPGLLCALEARRNYCPIGSHFSDDDPLIIEKNKIKNLSGKTVGNVKSAPKWNQFLASDSEAYIKADRDPDLDIRELQEQSVADIKADSDGIFADAVEGDTVEETHKFTVKETTTRKVHHDRK
ncbi:hypothetical protein BZG36_01199 [Bifiguratus adelaidae]|uniref:Uncharacterized protein n=1 Tax=Bifiguratus adelaidae TaxID=1938954 RepID=A0A261Y5M3_9FUNG|nr:hypothetical protein BZG36_01199 [Bifiguratus adelaidae]